MRKSFLLCVLVTILLVLLMVRSSHPQAERIVNENPNGCFGVGRSLVAEESVESELKPLWNRTYGGAASDFVSRVIEVSSGGYAAIGWTQSYGSGMNDMWLIRILSDGVISWNRTFGGIEDDRGYDLLELDDGFMLVGKNATPLGDQYIWVVRTDLNGQEVWNKTYTAGWGRGIVEHNDGQFSIVGEVSNDLYLLRIDGDGNQIRAGPYEGIPGSVSVGSVMSTDDNGLIVVGQGNYVSSESSGAFIVKFNNDWRVQWMQVYDGLGYYRAHSTCRTNDGGYVLVGLYSETAFDPPSNLVVRMDPDGRHVWTRTYGGSGAESVVAVGSSDCVVVGTAGGQMRFLRLDESGEIVSDQRFGGSGNEIGLSGLIPDDGGFLLAGITSSYGQGSYDAWMLRLPTLEWVEQPSDVQLEYLNLFEYALEANSSAGITLWSLNDTLNFHIDSMGLVSNVSVLPVGEYPLLIWANDTAGGVLAAEFTVSVHDTIPPDWIETPTDQFLEAGDVLNYDINASDPNGLSKWMLNVTTAFSIDSEGVVRTPLRLPVGEYHVEVSVSDVHNNWRSHIFAVTVEDTTAPDWVFPPEDQSLGFNEGIDYVLYA
ncbi:hypothetical protein EU538_13005, partial [Candidatus Thorarchaeota archaeon]